MKSCSSLPHQDLLTAYGEGFFGGMFPHVDITVRGHGMSVPKPGYLSDEALLKNQKSKYWIIICTQ